MMNVYRNRFSYDFDSEGNVIDAVVGFNGMNNEGESTMSNIKVTKGLLGEGKDFDSASITEVTEIAKQKWVKMISTTNDK